jgi:hypothetical protein
VYGERSISARVHLVVGLVVVLFKVGAPDAGGAWEKAGQELQPAIGFLHAGTEEHKRRVDVVVVVD